jgi:hypothetical protein
LTENVTRTMIGAAPVRVKTQRAVSFSRLECLSNRLPATVSLILSMPDHGLYALAAPTIRPLATSTGLTLEREVNVAPRGK